MVSRTPKPMAQWRAEQRQAFWLYIEAGWEETIRRGGRSRATIERWSRDLGWVFLRHLYNAESARQELMEALQARREMLRLEFKLASALAALAAEAATEQNASEWSPGELVRVNSHALDILERLQPAIEIADELESEDAIREYAELQGLDPDWAVQEARRMRELAPGAGAAP